DAMTPTPHATRRHYLLVVYRKGPHQGSVQHMLGELDGDTWRLCAGLPGKDTGIGEFDAKAGSGRWLVTFKRTSPPPGVTFVPGPPGPQTVLKKFDPKADKPYQLEFGGRNVMVEENGWRIEAKKASPSGPEGGIDSPSIKLFELPVQGVRNHSVVLRFKMKTEKVTYLANVGLQVGGRLLWLDQGSSDPASGTTNWKSYEIQYECK